MLKIPFCGWSWTQRQPAARSDWRRGSGVDRGGGCVLKSRWQAWVMMGEGDGVWTEGVMGPVI